jgi:hypothetical protein
VNQNKPFLPEVVSVRDFVTAMRKVLNAEVLKLNDNLIYLVVNISML